MGIVRSGQQNGRGLCFHVMWGMKGRQGTDLIGISTGNYCLCKLVHSRVLFIIMGSSSTSPDEEEMIQSVLI